jgi:hypothetical protein
VHITSPADPKIICRHLNIGRHGSTLATENPPSTQLLPASDTDWEDGIMIPSERLLSAQASLPVGYFARIAQAANLLGQVQRHNQELNSRKSQFFYDESLQLSRTLHALIDVLIAERESMMYSTAEAICYCALFCLHAQDCELDPEEDVSGEYQLHALNILKKRAESARESCEYLNSQSDTSLQRISPLIFHSIYYSTIMHSWYIRESGTQEFVTSFEMLRSILMRLNQRWKSAGLFHKLSDDSFQNLRKQNR